MLKRGVTFLPIHWQKNIATGRSTRWQEVINDQISDCDMIIAIVGTRMGTTTIKADSGTAEEVFDFCEKESFANTSYNTHVFFNTFYNGNVLNLELEQLGKVQKFESDIRNLGVLYAPFSNLSTLRNLTNKALDAFYFQSKQTQSISIHETEMEELGLDEYLKNTENDFENMTFSLLAIADSMTTFSKEASHAKDAKTKKLALELGVTAINNFANKIAKKSQHSQESLDSAYSNLNSALKLAVEDFLNEDNINELQNLITTLIDLIKSGKEGQAGMQSLERAIMELPRRNKEVIKAKKRILIPISGLNNSLIDFNNNVDLIVREVEVAIKSFKNNGT